MLGEEVDVFAEDVDGGDAVLGKEGGGRGAEEVCRLRFAIRAGASNEATFSSRRVRSAASEEAGAE